MFQRADTDSSFSAAAASSSSESPLSPSLLAREMARWSNEFRPLHGFGFGGHPGRVSPELLSLIGRWGEAMVYQILVAEQAARPPSEALVVTWVNAARESGRPYDLTVSVQDEGTTGRVHDRSAVGRVLRSVEVKSTLSSAVDSLPFDGARGRGESAPPRAI